VEKPLKGRTARRERRRKEKKSRKKKKNPFPTAIRKPAKKKNTPHKRGAKSSFDQAREEAFSLEVTRKKTKKKKDARV